MSPRAVLLLLEAAGLPRCLICGRCHRNHPQSSPSPLLCYQKKKPTRCLRNNGADTHFDTSARVVVLDDRASTVRFPFGPTIIMWKHGAQARTITTSGPNSQSGGGWNGFRLTSLWKG